MTTRPILFLDIDGVLNVDKHLAWPDGPWIVGPVASRADGTGAKFPFQVARPVLDALTDLHVSGRLEIQWATTWNHEDSVASVEKALEFGPFHRAFKIASLYDAPDAKADAVRLSIQSGRRTIWAEDWMPPGFAEQAAQWADPADFLLIEPDPTLGLTPEDIEKIRAFCCAGCCESCGGTGVGGPASDASTNGRCSDCRATGHLHHS